ncbi:CDP-alcohol phosphatidyltransferase family protein [Hoyosella rhizosphaerae]|uniref:Phosphatidylinositol phosphate synthase n=1 Tax=Hoyosella rhizosphaerae TaxID=1755582 RepID=A0A916XAG3_9ACTN|nr:CDP-alcohol phosphatidyltransferase family protein [Hoyosella rhizosphaerae]MBN4926409.1 CDP-alcohol phosphatidyltransferase family protein [Hoyosella rhizosphaerae]GGC59601.1 putative phosphatidylinositol synthase PgsA [Hoyosella rhizosphaerae]
MLSVFGRPSVSKVTAPIGRALIRAGISPDAVTIFGTAVTVVTAVALFPRGYLFWGAILISAFVLLDLIDGAMARARGGGTPFGAVLDATGDRIADGAIFGALAFWAAFHTDSTVLVVLTLFVLVASQVISYVKARAEASGLSADGGLIERSDRLVIVLLGAGFTGIGVGVAIHIAMWVLAVGSAITIAQRLLAVRSSPGARTIIPISSPQGESEGETQ